MNKFKDNWESMNKNDSDVSKYWLKVWTVDGKLVYNETNMGVSKAVSEFEKFKHIISMDKRFKKIEFGNDAGLHQVIEK
jgi:hypothetical protein